MLIRSLWEFRIFLISYFNRNLIEQYSVPARKKKTSETEFEPQVTSHSFFI
jgi:hypothetical protein